MMKSARACIAMTLLILVGIANAAEPAFDVAAHYDKREMWVPMRDGVKLYTILYSPKKSAAKLPILLNRTPYWIGPYGEGKYKSAMDMAPSEDFLRDGYLFVFQEIRGTYRSEGEWIDFRPLRRDTRGVDESTDTYDCIEWLIRNLPGHNGRVGQWGISYPGWATVLGMVDAHPALKASSPQATTADPFVGDDYHHNGAFILLNLGFLSYMSAVTGPGRAELGEATRPIGNFPSLWPYEAYLQAGPTDELDAKYFDGRMMAGWKAFIEHPDYDEYWQERDFLRPLSGVRHAILNVAGWFDQPDPYGQIATYRSIEQKNPRNESILVVGPWRHAGWHEDDGASLGDIDFGSATTAYYQKNVVFPFFQHHLKGQGEWRPAEALAFETGVNRWHSFEQWPPRGVQGRNLYFHANGKLSFEPPAEGDARDSYLSDPARPVPYAPPGNEGLFTIADQRYAFTRPDVLSYQSEVLTEDVTIAGPIPIRLRVSTSGTDSDWFVKLIDVLPPDAPNNGRGVRVANYQMLLGHEVMRGKYRNSLSSPEAMVPERVTPVNFQIHDRFHTFRKGHRIMVQIHSSWFPLFDRNPHKFMNIYRAKPGDYQQATQRVYRSREHASHLVLPIVSLQ